MKSPKDMRIIQIDITNACVFQCSNCTRFCGHHKKPFFMDYETFVRAVDSLDGYVGTIGMMGGEPTLNPDFERMADYLGSKKPAKVSEVMYRPQRHFMDTIHDLESDHTFLYPCSDGSMRQTVDGPGLWATTKGNYKKYYETIQDVVQYQALNDHSRPMYHQPGLISRKALGIDDAKWNELRDKCWIQNVWSASITPKGAFFCEVAAALDMLFDGPGGWNIEPDWWKKTPDEFGDQLQWCEMCGLACQTFTRNANEQVYDVSEDIYKKLKESGSRLVGTDHINVVRINNGDIDPESKADGKRFSESMPYTASYSARFDETTTQLTEKKIIGLIWCESIDHVDYAAESASFFEKAIIYASEKILRGVKERVNDLALNDREKYGELTFATDEKSIGEMIFDVLKSGKADEYLMILRGAVRIRNVLDDLMSVVLNPGTILYTCFDNQETNDYFMILGDGEVALLSGAAKSYRHVAEETKRQFAEISQLVSKWDQKKVFPFHPDTVYTAPTVEVKRGKKYVIYGCGKFMAAAIKSITEGGAQIVAAVDSDKNKWGTVRRNYLVEEPDKILSYREQYDCVMIASRIYYKEIKRILYKYGITEEDMAWV